MATFDKDVKEMEGSSASCDPVSKQIGPYDIIQAIGHGSFSKIFLVSHRLANTFHVCKAVSRQFLAEENLVERFEREIRLLASLKHPSLVRMDTVIYEEDYIFIIMEYCPNGELFDRISLMGKMSEVEAKHVFSRIVDGVAYMHSKNVAHRDIKPENILLDANFNPKIADFGLSQHTNSNRMLKTPCGSPFYAAPEIISGQSYDGKMCDIWSLGVVLFTMMSGSLPWSTTNQTLLFNEICSAEFYIPKYISPKCSDLIRQLMRLSPSDRPTAEEIKDHPWLCEDTIVTAPSIGRRMTLLNSIQEKMESSLIAQQQAFKRRGSHSTINGGKKPFVIRPETNNHPFSAAVQSMVHPLTIRKQVPKSSLRPQLSILRPIQNL